MSHMGLKWKSGVISETLRSKGILVTLAAKGQLRNFASGTPFMANSFP